MPFIASSSASAAFEPLLADANSTLAGLPTLIGILGIFSTFPGCRVTLFPLASSIVKTLPVLVETLYVVGVPFTVITKFSPAFRLLGRVTVAEVTLILPSEFASSLLSLPFLSLSSSISTLSAVPAPPPCASSKMSLTVPTLSTPVLSETVAFIVVV